MPPARTSSEASSHGDLACAWSRSAMTSSLGESGLSVFHAGHWLWQRPHSVQVVKSSRPFQVKSSTLPTPSAASSSRSSTFSKSSTSPPTRIGCSSPRLVRPSAWRLKKMLKKARKRCQATPIVGCRAIVIIHAKEMRILIAAMMTMRFLIVSSESPVKKLPIQPVSGKCRRACPCRCRACAPSVHSSARSRPMQMVTPRIVELDVVGLPPRRAEEAAAAPVLAGGRARVVLLPDRDEHEDAEEAREGEEVGDPLVGEEVADDRQREVRRRRAGRRR